MAPTQSRVFAPACHQHAALQQWVSSMPILQQTPFAARKLSYQSPQRSSLSTHAAAQAAVPDPSAADTDSNTQQVSATAFFKVVGPTALALLLCNMDRICMSVAIVPMAQEFGWPAGVQGLVQSGFLWGYMATQMIGGSLADRYGGRAVMAYSILWFSTASLLMPIALSAKIMAAGLTLPAVMLARGLVGLGEGVALPAMNNLVANNVPPARRSTALGGCFSGFHTGNLVGLFLSPLILQKLGWRGLFYTFGVLGYPLLAIWLAIVPKPKAKQDSAAQTEEGFLRATTPHPNPIRRIPMSPDPDHDMEKAIAAAPAGRLLQQPQQPEQAAKAPPANINTLKLLSSKATWAIIVVNFVNHWGYFIYLNWMPSYFVKALGFNLRASSFLSFLPWTVMALGSSAAGLLADGLIKKGVSVTQVRKRLQTVAFLGPALALVVLSRSKDPRLAVACMTCALGITSLGQAGFVANMSDIAPRYAGRLFGLANTFGSFAGILGVSAVGFVVEKTGSFDPVFKLTAVLYIVATIVWNLLCTGEKVFD